MKYRILFIIFFLFSNTIGSNLYAQQPSLEVQALKPKKIKIKKLKRKAKKQKNCRGKAKKIAKEMKAKGIKW